MNALEVTVADVINDFASNLVKDYDFNLILFKEKVKGILLVYFLHVVALTELHSSTIEELIALDFFSSLNGVYST